MAPSSLIGEIARVTITEASANSLFGELARNDAQMEPLMLAESGV
jgi:hypothetical protein